MKTIQPFGFYILRRPLLSADVLFNLLDSAIDKTSFEAELRNIYMQPQMQEAVYLASPDLFNCVQKWLQGAFITDKEKFLQTLYKYFSRASIRCTPFGMFAGCTTVGSFDSHTSISIQEEEPFTKHSRLDMNYMAELTQSIEFDPLIRKQLKYYPNNSIYQIGDELRYTFYHVENKARKYSICSVKLSPYLKNVLEEAKKGAKIQELITPLISDEISYQEAEEFIHHLIDEQLLTSEIQLTVTGKEFFNLLIDRLSFLDNTSAFLQNLQEIRALLCRQDHQIDKYFKIKEIIGQNFIQSDHKDLVQTDIHFHTDSNTIGKDVLQYLTKTFEKLLVLNQGNYNVDLDNFKKRFYERYEGQEVPLLVALDHEAGVGYGDDKHNQLGHLPLIDNFTLSYQKDTPVIEWNTWKDFVLRKYSEALFRNEYEITLTDDDLLFLKENLNISCTDIKGSFAAFGNLIAESEKALDNGNFSFNLYQIAGPSGVNLLGRFCHGDQTLLLNVKDCLELEEKNNPDIIFAEIVHLPQERTGNILMRPAFSKYEIPYLAKSSVDEEFQILLSDLTVSIRNGKEIILRSVKNNKQVIPRLTTAHNFSQGLSIYKFLCDLQYQYSSPNILWHWAFLEKQNFLPRVCYEKIILSRATWTLALKDYPDIKTKSLNSYTYFKNVREKLRLPQYVLIAESDNELLIDFENMHCLELLKEHFLKKELITLREYLQEPQKCLLKDKVGKYTNEIIIPFYKISNQPTSSISIAVPHLSKRNFSLGSEWLYIKIYAGEKTGDNLLKGSIKNLIDELLLDKFIDKYFFIRYADPDPHIRIRFHGDPGKNFYEEVLKRLHLSLEPYLQKGLIHKLQTDTYKREIERYGNNTIILSESLFYNDSNAVLEFLTLLDGDLIEKYCWLFAISGIDSLLNDFNYSLFAKKKLLERLYQQYSSKFSINGKTKEQLNTKYRQHAKDIEIFLDDSYCPEKIKIVNILNKRSARNKDIADKIFILTHHDDLKMDNLLNSYIHMFINRLFLSKQQLHELIIYHYMCKYYKSVQGKNKIESATFECTVR